jgi:hypothetical protein
MKQRVYTIILTKGRGIGEELKGVTILVRKLNIEQLKN